MLTFLVWDPYKPSFVTTRKGYNPRYTFDLKRIIPNSCFRKGGFGNPLSKTRGDIPKGKLLKPMFSPMILFIRQNLRKIPKTTKWCLQKLKDMIRWQKPIEFPHVHTVDHKWLKRQLHHWCPLSQLHGQIFFTFSDMQTDGPWSLWHLLSDKVEPEGMIKGNDEEVVTSNLPSQTVFHSDSSDKITVFHLLLEFFLSNSLCFTVFHVGHYPNPVLFL